MWIIIITLILTQCVSIKKKKQKLMQFSHFLPYALVQRY